MEPVVRYSLCPECPDCVDCVACPEVVIYPDQVIIGEEGNQVRLTPREWERLVMAVRSGELGPISADP
jgi:hypothetical protein